MKTVFDLIYCETVLTSQVVFYHVLVGCSHRDHSAFEFVKSVAKAPSFFFVKHSLEVQNFVDKCAASIFNYSGRDGATRFLRRKVVNITWLAAFLKRAPPCLLNSTRIE